MPIIMLCNTCNRATSHICMNCPPKNRCYFYCILHELHASHTNQSSCRRSNIPIICSSDNNISSSSNSNTSSNLSNNNNSISSSINNNTSRPARNNRKRSLEEDEMCTCGCKTMRNSNSMADCKGTDCRNRVHFACVPSTWLCLTCSSNISELNKL